MREQFDGKNLPSSRPWVVLAAISTTLGACFARELTLELMVKDDPGCGNLITFASFIFITIEGFIFTTKCGTVKPKVPLRSWTCLVLMYFAVTVINNYALTFSISMPLHMIFRSGSLFANMLLGVLILRRQYSSVKYASVAMITAGIATCTIMSSKEVAKATPDSDAKGAENQAWHMINWLIGVGLLTIGLFIAASMGIFQERIHTNYGKHPKEALFYTHFLPLPCFLMIAPELYSHAVIAWNSPSIALIGISMPRMCFYTVFNVVAQYLCISAVFVLTSECTSLTVTLIVTLRKFISLLFSIWYFQNPFTLSHWCGTALVFAGTLMFSDVPRKIKEALYRSSQDVIKKQQ